MHFLIIKDLTEESKLLLVEHINLDDRSKLYMINLAQLKEFANKLGDDTIVTVDGNAIKCGVIVEFLKTVDIYNA